MSVHAFMQSMYFYVQYCGIEINHISLGYPVSHDFINIWIKTFMKFKFSFIQRIIIFVNVVVTIITFYCVDKCKFIIWYKFNFGVRDLSLFIYTFWNAFLYWNNSQASYSCLNHHIKYTINRFSYYIYYLLDVILRVQQQKLSYFMP